jgi:hypothetical protein
MITGFLDERTIANPLDKRGRISESTSLAPKSDVTIEMGHGAQRFNLKPTQEHFLQDLPIHPT